MLGFLGKIFGIGAAEPIEAIGNVVDNIFTSDEERLDKKIVLERLKAMPHLAQAEINKVEASHRSLFVAGWRPAIGWVAAVSLGAYYIPQYLVATYLWIKMTIEMGTIATYPASPDGLMELVIALLGLGGLRSVEKIAGKTK